MKWWYLGKFYIANLVGDTGSSHSPILSNHKHWYNNIGHHFCYKLLILTTVVCSLLQIPEVFLKKVKSKFQDSEIPFSVLRWEHHHPRCVDSIHSYWYYIYYIATAIIINTFCPSPVQVLPSMMGFSHKRMQLCDAIYLWFQRADLSEKGIVHGLLSFAMMLLWQFTKIASSTHL